MGKTIIVFTLLAFTGVLGGCTGNGELMRRAVSTESNGRVFEEIGESAAPAAGYADLKVYCSLKTHKAGSHSVSDLHGAPDFVLALNIDGQALMLRAATREEKGECNSPTDPEEGDGIRYEFTKRLRMKAGSHRIIIAIPSDKVVLAQEISLSEDMANQLILKPVYGRLTGNRRGPVVTSYKEGIRGFQMILNGKPL